VAFGNISFSCILSLKAEIAQNEHYQDTLMEMQHLYNGKIWTNKFLRINGDQFLFANYFLPGTVSSKGHTFKNLLIKYNIFTDEIMIPADKDEIIQLNKEIIDSFTINFENDDYKFENLRTDTLSDNKGFNGYVNVLYRQKSDLFVKFKKEIRPGIKDNIDVEFVQTQKIYIVSDRIVSQISGKNDLSGIFIKNKEQIFKYIKDNRLKLTTKKPDSFIPVLSFIDSIGH
jgi:hypothetical protein